MCGHATTCESGFFLGEVRVYSILKCSHAYIPKTICSSISSIGLCVFVSFNNPIGHDGSSRISAVSRFDIENGQRFSDCVEAGSVSCGTAHQVGAPWAAHAILQRARRRSTATLYLAWYRHLLDIVGSWVLWLNGSYAILEAVAITNYHYGQRTSVAEARDAQTQEDQKVTPGSRKGASPLVLNYETIYVVQKATKETIGYRCSRISGPKRRSTSVGACSSFILDNGISV